MSKTENPHHITPEQIAQAEQLIGLRFTDAERKQMVNKTTDNLGHYEKIRAVSLDNAVPPALYFNPNLSSEAETTAFQRTPLSISPISPSALPNDLSSDLKDLAFYPVTHLAALMQSRQITSVALTEMYLQRLKRYGPQLECIITLTEDLALSQAQQVDAEIEAGHYRGPLHGIPWGAKDLLAVKGYPTTWGAMPYQDQILAQDATVVQRLNKAGAVLVAKLTLGALAMGDVWFGGKTRTPWNIEEGSSGSSAGSGAATAAGLVGFAIGTETYGSIVSPSTQCGLSGLRPTFGRVSRQGAMALSWSMDKIGPMCRSVEDCALVFQAIYGPDGQDLSVTDHPFTWQPELDLSQLRIGYLKKAFAEDYPSKAQDQQSLDVLQSLGINLISIDLPDYPLDSLSIVLYAEAAAAFDDLTRSNQDDLLVRQAEDAWPNFFRLARLIPAVEYIQANRIRSLLIQDMAQVMNDIDVYLAPSFGPNLLLTNLTGHPAVVVPNGFAENRVPTSISFTGRLFDEATVLAVAKTYQEATEFHRQQPVLIANT